MGIQSRYKSAKAPLGEIGVTRKFLLGALLASSSALEAAQGPAIEEVIVTAQRIEEPASKVPISLSAFTDVMMSDRQIIGIKDLQVNVPNLTYTQESFYGAKVVIRGIGDSTYDVLSRGFVSPGVPIHWNGVSTPMRISAAEFYDVERLEVLRGPQGTLYGRNSNAGSINIITNMPKLNEISGYVDLEYGDYDHKRVKSAVNLPIGDRLAVRAAGMWLERDGYIENKAADLLPDLDNRIDSRDLYSYRITALWQPVDNIRVWLMHDRFKEDDTRVPVHNVVCSTSVLPTQGCEADEFGLAQVHQGVLPDSIIAANAGAIPFGARDATDGLVFEYPRPELGLREQHTDVNPIYEEDQEAWLFGAELVFDRVTLEIVGSYFESTLRTRNDEQADVGYVLNPIPQNPDGLWPTSGPSGGVGALRGGGPCDLESGRAGVAGGCVLNRLNRRFSYAEGDAEDESWSMEIRLRSDLAGRFNFLLGANYLDVERDLEFYRASNAFDIPGLIGYPATGFTQFYPSFFSLTDEHLTESSAAFGEAYFDFTDRLKFTLGFRYNNDDVGSIREVVQFQAINLTPGPGGTLGNPTWVRFPMTGFLSGEPNPYALFLADRYGATSAIENARTFDELVAALQIVPITSRPGEQKAFLGLPTKEKFEETSVRAVLDWQVNDDSLVYLSFSQGYRPGGQQSSFNKPTYDAETVNAYELGSKTRWLEGRLAVNAALFFNDYQDLQLFSRGETAVVNVGAETMGLDLEVSWYPEAIPGLAVDFSYAWLDAEYDSSMQLDPTDRAQGDPSVVVLRNPDLSAGAFVAPTADVLPLVDFALAVEAAQQVEGAEYENGIPVYFSRAFLDFFGVETSSGSLVDIGGNRPANSPPHSASLGLAYTWMLGPGALTARYDLHWQDDSYGREFNTRGDRIDDWVMQNASLIFESANGRWSARAWIRNIADKTIVTGHYVQNEASGAFRNYFLAEPRIFGASFRYNFGAL
jgi:outer membrane receptor protein involved in Fe transport